MGAAVWRVCGENLLRVRCWCGLPRALAATSSRSGVKGHARVFAAYCAVWAGNSLLQLHYCYSMFQREACAFKKITVTLFPPIPTVAPSACRHPVSEAWHGIALTSLAYVICRHAVSPLIWSIIVQPAASKLAPAPS